MKQQFQHLFYELSDTYSTSEVSALMRIVLEELCSDTCGNITSDKINHLSDSELKKAEDIVRRLKAGEPIQYILGKSEFFGLPFTVTPDVLIPRPETEELVEWVLLETSKAGGCRVLDIGTGSGCIAITIAKKMMNADVHAWDISAQALAVASHNARVNGVKIRFSEQDIFTPIADNLLSRGGAFDVIVSNPPYVTESEKSEMEDNVLKFEPHQALFVPDCDPLKFYDRIAVLSKDLLSAGGALYFEVNREYGEDVCQMLLNKGFTQVELKKDISGNNRMVRGKK